MKLVWIKNNVILNSGDRVFTLDYKQSNNTRISLLKFGYSLSTDTGVYKCFVAKKSHLNDYFNLNIIPSESNYHFLNDFIKLLKLNFYFYLKDETKNQISSYFKLPFFVDKANSNGNNKIKSNIKVFIYVWVIIFFI